VGSSSVVLPQPDLYEPTDAEIVKAAYADQQAMVPSMIPDPSIGLYSPTDLSMSGTLANTFFDGIGEMVTGRSPLSNLDQLLKDWRTAGGDRLRGEFERSYAEAKR
jgi:putative aldouronate transport system substrate-binding protein